MRAADAPTSEAAQASEAERQLATHCEVVRLIAGATTLEAAAPSVLETVQLQLGQLVERTRAESELARGRELLAGVIEGLPDPVFVKDAEGRYLVVNEAAARADGLAKPDLLGKTDLEFRPAEAAA